MFSAESTTSPLLISHENGYDHLIKPRFSLHRGKSRPFFASKRSGFGQAGRTFEGQTPIIRRKKAMDWAKTVCAVVAAAAAIITDAVSQKE